MKKRIVVIMMVSLLLTGCGKSEVKQEKAPKLVEPVSAVMDTEKVVKSEIYNIKSMQAEVVPAYEKVEIGSDGAVGSVEVKLGEQVKKGDQIGALREIDYADDVKALKDELEAMRKTNDYNNSTEANDITIQKEELKQLNKQLSKEKDSKKKTQLTQEIKTKKADISIAELTLKQKKELQQVDYDKKQKELDNKKSVAGDYEMIAPISGTISFLNAKEGLMVESGDLMAIVADMNKPKLITDFVSESDVLKANHAYVIYNGKEYDIEQEEYDKEKAAEMLDAGQEISSYFTLKDKDVKLNIGDVLTVCLISDYVADALVVPSNAVFKDGDTRYVYLMEKDSKVRKEISIGTVTDTYTQIKDGVKEGDVVYVQK